MDSLPKPVNVPLPPGWGKDKLSKFLWHARNNQLATFANKPTEYAKLLEIDGVFLAFCGHMLNPRNMFSANLLYRSHSSYRAACGNSMSGQAVETYPQLRQCLEFAAYGLRIFKRPELGEVWLDRHEGEASKRAMKREFLVDADDRVHLHQLYLHADDDALLMALKTTAQVGLTALHIYQHVFPERFMLLGLREKMLQLRDIGL